MLNDPQTVTVNSVAKVMPRILNNGQKSLYRLPDQTFALDIQHVSRTRDKKSRAIHTVKLTQGALVTDPITSVVDFEFASVSVQIDRPLAGFTSLQIQQLCAGLFAHLSAATVDKLYGGES